MSLNINPPISSHQIDDLISRAEQFNSKDIDGKVVAFAIRLAYLCALRTSEMVSLTITDVYGRGNALDTIERLSEYADDQLNEVRLTENVKEIVVGYVGYLRSTREENPENPSPFRYNTYTYSPLLPRKNGSSYDEPTLRRHFKSVAGDDETWKGAFESIRRTGICKRAEELEASGTHSESWVLEKTAEFARISKSRTKRLVAGSPHQPGKTHQSRMNYLKSNEQIGFSKMVSLIEEASGQQYMKDSDETVEFKEAFFNAVDRNTKMTSEDKQTLKTLFIEELGL